MTKMFGRAVLAASVAVTVLSMALSAAEGRDLDRSILSTTVAPTGLSAPLKNDRGDLGPTMRLDGGAYSTPSSSRRRRASRHFNTRVAPRPDCELGLHGCFVRNGDRHGAF